MESALNFDEIGSYPESTEVVQVGTILDLDIIRPKFADYKTEAGRIATEATALTVQDQDSLNIAVALGGNAKKIGKAIDAQRKSIILEPAEFVKGVNAICKAITDSLDEAERTAKGKIGQYQAKVELDRREAERKAREATEALQRRLQAEVDAANRKAAEEARLRVEAEQKAKREKEEAEARERGAKKAEMDALAKRAADELYAALQMGEAEAAKNAILAPTVVAPVVAEAPRVTRTESGSSYQSKRWTCRIVDEKKIPREYCEPSQKLLNDSVKMGIRVIEGCVIEEVSETRFRT